MTFSFKRTHVPVSIVIIMLFLLYSFTQQNISHNDEDKAQSKDVHTPMSKAYKNSDNTKSKYVSRNEDIRKVFQASLTTIQTTCERYKSENTTKEYKLPDLKNFSLEPRHKLIICRTAKHGSTSWAHNFVQIYQK